MKTLQQIITMFDSNIVQGNFSIHKPIDIKMSRVWSMPNSNTFKIKPIREFVDRWIDGVGVIIDPFARDSKIGTYTNDLNPNTDAEFHMEAGDFLDLMLVSEVKAGAVIFDPPYSLTQVSKSYAGIGLKFRGKENPTGGFPKVRDKIAKILCPNGIVLSFGWNTVGMGKKRGFEIVEILIVCHGGNRNDTLCIAERRIC